MNKNIQSNIVCFVIIFIMKVVIDKDVAENPLLLIVPCKLRKFHYKTKTLMGNFHIPVPTSK